MKKSDEFISVVDKNKALVKYLWRILMMQSIAFVALSFAFFSIKDTVMVKVEMPSKLMYKYTPVVVAGVDGANEIYYKMWGKYIVEEVSSFKYEEFDTKLNKVQLMMRPSQYNRTVDKFKTFAEIIKTNLISQDYKVISSSLNNIKKNDNGTISSALFISNGISKQKIGKSENNKECKYSVNLKYVRGVIYVEDFGTDCF